MERNDAIQVESNGYKLLTSQLKPNDTIQCPEKDITCTKISEEEIELFFHKKVTFIKSAL